MRCPSAETLLIYLISLLIIMPVNAQDNEDQKWLDRLIPLPKEIQFEGYTIVSADDVSVCVRNGATELESNAAKQLAIQLDVPIHPGDNAGRCDILVGIIDDRGMLNDVSLKEDASRLRTLPNSDQAYVIRCLDNDRVVLAALNEYGVYYAVQTFRQLLDNISDDRKLTLPQVTVTDWPDMAYRGVWDDTFPPEQVEWMASYKMNRVDCHSRLTVDKQGNAGIGSVPAKGPEYVDGMDYPTFCHMHAVHYVPIIHHFSHLKRTGIYEAFPVLLGKGASLDDRFIPPCASQPEFADVLAIWMEELAARPNIDEISVWLSEVEHHCQCDMCRKNGQYVMETRAIVSAYSRVREKFPSLRLRILLTQGSYPDNDKILAELPEGIGVIYYHGEKTYDSSREPMIPFALREFAVRNGMLGVCPQLTVSWAVVCPWTSPQFVRTRMIEYVDKKLDLLSAYATPDLTLYEFNVIGAAEWSWNAHGRSEREFARVWAIRKGMKDPELFADWTVRHGDVSWDIYGSEVPFDFAPDFGTAMRMIEHKVPPVLGEEMFRYFPTADHFDRALAACDKDIEVAQELGDPYMLQETLVVRGYISFSRELYTIAELISRTGMHNDSVRSTLEMHYNRLDDARRTINDALLHWEALFGEGAGGGRLRNTLKLTDDIVSHVKKNIE